MKIEEYKGISKLTGVFPQKVDDFGKAYAIFGILDELEEFAEATREEDIIKEAGDVCWYVDCACEQFGVDQEDIFNVGAFYWNDKVDEIFGVLKKYYRDGKEIDKEVVTAYLKSVMVNIRTWIDDLDISFEKVLQTNYDKVIDRKKRGVIQGDGDNR